MSKEINPFEKYDKLFDEQDNRFKREDKKQFKTAKKLEPSLIQKPGQNYQIITTIAWIFIFTFVAPRIFINFRFFGVLIISLAVYLVYQIFRANKIK
jgi:hypothetical protein